MTAEETAKDQEVKLYIKLPCSSTSGSRKNQQESNQLELLFTKDAKVQHVLDVIAVTQATKFLTNVDLVAGKTVLKDNTTLAEIAGNEKTVKLQLQNRPYTTRDALKHILTLREYLGFTPETSDGLSEFATSAASKFFELPLSAVKEKSKQEESEAADGDAESSKKLELNVTDEEKAQFVKLVHEIFGSISSSSACEVNASQSSIITPCLRSLCLSAYNPVPAFYRTKGHLLYLQAVTLEGETLQITCIPSGFYVNKSTNSKFDPSPRTAEDGSFIATQHSLYDLLCLSSKKLSSRVSAFERKVNHIDTAAYVKPVNTLLHKPWIVSTASADNGDYIRLQLDSLKFDSERNFNDEFQAIKDLPIQNIQSRMDSERLLSKIVHEFSVAATRGAMSIFYHDLISMNPEAPAEEQIYLKEGIFYSFVTDVSGNYMEKGGNDAARAASNQDLRTINLLNRLNTQDLRYLLTAIIDFGGNRILAQTPVPGLLSTMGTQVIRDPETGKEVIEDLPNEIAVSYGFDEAANRVVGSEKFDAIIQKEFSKVFHLTPHKVDGAQISFSSQSKGIVGFDKRHYILDLANTYPLDIKFVRECFDNANAEKRYPHRQTLLRPELVEKWWHHKREAEGLDYKTAYEDGKFSFNPDAYHVEGVEDPVVDEISDYLHDVVLPSLVQDYAAGNVAAPYNGEHVVDTLHINGINVRYLGKVIHLAKDILAKQSQEYEERLKSIAEGNKEHEEWERNYLLKVEKLIKERQEKINKYVQDGKEVPKELTENIKLDDSEIRKPTKEEPFIINRDELLPLIHVCEIEIFARATKHVLRKYSKDLPVFAISALVCFVFNLLFGAEFNDSPHAEDVDCYRAEDFKFSSLTRSSLLSEIFEQAFLRFRYELPEDWMDQHKKAPLFLMRAICYKFGIQIINRRYFFNKEEFENFKQSQDKKTRNKLITPMNTFSIDDFIIIPRVKSTEYNSLVSDELWAEGAATIKDDQSLALKFLSQAISVKEDVSTVLHQSVAEKYLSLSTIYNNIGKVPEAVAFARKSCIIYERVCGIDSFEMLRALSNLAILELSGGSPLNAAVVYKRIVETVQSFDLTAAHHPIVVSALNHLEQMALGMRDPKLAIEILKKLSELIVALDGNESLAFGYVESRVGNLYATLDDMPRALEHISSTKDIFVRELGLNHELSAQAKQWNEGLTNLIKNKQQQKMLQKQKAAANESDFKKQSKAKKDQAVPEIANKSVDELLDFIEGSSDVTSSKSKSRKKGKNKKK
ncbi:hypothetical protein HG536_0G01280 [Torulaspora globosa]|uniref:Clustered mitochondria protein homolog n=1 Tax=Torulaspora globosa TaxID=48254 RepID=A0A7G3ZL83_9SACH|nr:uncharacterized protein HG536_0G01280 [Torulaspora globosa]QLL34269.1 hypothetical protein HG536_0G01280 [Torulaspora globosa]